MFVATEKRSTSIRVPGRMIGATVRSLRFALNDFRYSATNECFASRSCLASRLAQTFASTTTLGAGSPGASTAEAKSSQCDRSRCRSRADLAANSDESCSLTMARATALPLSAQGGTSGMSPVGRWKEADVPRTILDFEDVQPSATGTLTRLWRS